MALSVKSSLLPATTLVALFVAFTLFMTALKKNFAAFGHGYKFGAFAFHPVLMVVTFVLLAPLGSLLFVVFERSFNLPHRVIKYSHAAIHMVCLIVGITGIRSMWKTHEHATHMQSLHSWVGIALIVGYGIQFAFGLLVFANPLVSAETRKMCMPLHRFLGATMTVAGLMVAVLGSLSLVWRGDTATCPGSQAHVATHDKWYDINVAAMVTVVGAVLLVATLVQGVLQSPKHTVPEEAEGLLA